jgi:hypothetical protein
MTQGEIRQEERTRAANIVRKAIPMCKCAYLKGYGSKCVRCQIIAEIEAKPPTTNPRGL